jgi:hypothetical protein
VQRFAWWWRCKCLAALTRSWQADEQLLHENWARVMLMQMRSYR